MTVCRSCHLLRSIVHWGLCSSCYRDPVTQAHWKAIARLARTTGGQNREVGMQGLRTAGRLLQGLWGESEADKAL